jgi:hypothetical protein
MLRLHQQDMVHRPTGRRPTDAAVCGGCWAMGVDEGTAGSTSDAGRLLWVAVWLRISFPPHLARSCRMVRRNTSTCIVHCSLHHLL